MERMKEHIQYGSKQGTTGGKGCEAAGRWKAMWVRSPTKLAYRNFTMIPATLYSNPNLCNEIFNVKK